MLVWAINAMSKDADSTQHFKTGVIKKIGVGEGDEK